MLNTKHETSTKTRAMGRFVPIILTKAEAEEADNNKNRKKRVCTHPNCKTHLSIYNKTRKCSIHDTNLQRKDLKKDHTNNKTKHNSILLLESLAPSITKHLNTLTIKGKRPERDKIMHRILESNTPGSSNIGFKMVENILTTHKFTKLVLDLETNTAEAHHTPGEPPITSLQDHFQTYMQPGVQRVYKKYYNQDRKKFRKEYKLPNNVAQNIINGGTLTTAYSTCRMIQLLREYDGVTKLVFTHKGVEDERVA